LDDQRARELLARQRERIETALAKRAGGGDGEADEQPVDTDAGLHDQEVDEGVAADLREEMAAIERAEERLENGTYGVSIESGKPIPDARLEAVPWAERTAEEQEHHETHR
jgi:DnaK suppressor protein